MVNPIPPSNSTPPEGVDPANSSAGSPAAAGGRQFLGMNFTADQWTKFMAILSQNLSEYMSRAFKRMIEQEKKAWRREQEGS